MSARLLVLDREEVRESQASPGKAGKQADRQTTRHRHTQTHTDTHTPAGWRRKNNRSAGHDLSQRHFELVASGQGGHGSSKH
eukprot:1741948-Rhodomonas_salina.2